MSVQRGRSPADDGSHVLSCAYEARVWNVGKACTEGVQGEATHADGIGRFVLHDQIEDPVAIHVGRLGKARGQHVVSSVPAVPAVVFVAGVTADTERSGDVMSGEGAIDVLHDVLDAITILD